MSDDTPHIEGTCGPDVPLTLHVIPVPADWSAEQAWEAISRGDLLTDPDPDWTVVEVEGGRQVGDVQVGGRLVRWYSVEAA